MEKKTLEFKGTLNDGSLEGYGAAYGNVDSYGDVIVAGSCKNGAEFQASGAILVGHDWGDLGVATIDDHREDDHGFWFKASFHSDDVSQRSRLRAQERLARGKTLGLSIGYQTLESESGKKDGQDVRYIKAYKLFEISMVMTPANDQARATGVKTRFEDDKDSARAALDSYLQRAKDLKALRESDGRKLSAQTRSHIEALAADCDELHQHFKELLAEPVEIVSADPAAVLALHSRFIEFEARMTGVLVGSK